MQYTKFMQKNESNRKQKFSNSRLPSKDEYDIKLSFLNALINAFTAKINIKSKSFYSKINSFLKNSVILNALSYDERGLLSFDAVLSNFRESKRTGKAIYEAAPYLSSFSRLLALIYREAADVLGEERAKEALKNPYQKLKTLYQKIPDLTGYIPPETMGLSSSSSSSSSSSAFGVRIMDSVIDYLVDDIIKKGEKFKAPGKIKGKKLTKELTENQNQ